jgi:serine/threonine protein kinase
VSKVSAVQAVASDSQSEAPADATQIRGLMLPAGSQESNRPVARGAVIADRHEVREQLGSGGMGVVYGAHDRIRGEDIALKVLNPQLLDSASATERFLAEARVSCKLSHPNIVRVYDVGAWGKHYYFTMERLRGRSLRQLLQERTRQHEPLALDEVVRIGAQLVDALDYAHRYIVHRDLKPENVWLEDDGTVKLMDFGIARVATQADMTMTGMTLGTANYMAPEQRANAKKVDWRADQYALGIMLYELLTGTVPMGSVTPPHTLRADVPRKFSLAVMRAMAPRPEQRFQSLLELRAAITDPGGIDKPRVAIWLGMAATVALVVWVGLKFEDTRAPASPRVKTISPPPNTTAAVPATAAPLLKPEQPADLMLQPAAQAVAPPAVQLSTPAVQAGTMAESTVERMRPEPAPPPMRELSEADGLRQLQALARAGDATAQTQLGMRYEQGLGVQQDVAVAIEWYKRAAMQGDPRAIDALQRLGPRRPLQRDNLPRNNLQRSEPTQPLQPLGPRNNRPGTQRPRPGVPR